MRKWGSATIRNNNFFNIVKGIVIYMEHIRLPGPGTQDPGPITRYPGTGSGETGPVTRDPGPMKQGT